jgi:hypothetical protein
MGRMTAERERGSEWHDDERRHRQDPDDSPSLDHPGGHTDPVAALGSGIGGLGAPAIRSQHGTESRADTPQQVGVTPFVVRQQRATERERRRRDVAPGASGYAQVVLPPRARPLNLIIA